MSLERNRDAFYALKDETDAERFNRLIVFFRAFDVAVREGDGHAEIFVSYNYWHPDQRCKTTRLSMATVSSAALAAGSAWVSPQDWRLLFESSPCLGLGDVTQLGREAPIRSNRTGGRIAFLGNEVLLTLGDVQMDGVDQSIRSSQSPDVDYGKIIAIDLVTGEARHYASGLRNSQGMVVADGVTYVSDHGAQGGDELNTVVEGDNFGWPEVTYGVNYNDHIWPLAAEQGRHEGFKKPIHAWVPSVASSALIAVNDAIPEWAGDLLMGSLKDQSLHRIRIEEGVVRYVEPIRIGQRVRALAQTADGAIWLWTDSEEIIRLTRIVGQDAVTQTMPAAMVPCAECHSGGAAPQLDGILGRTIGLDGIDGTWDEASLRQFLTDPHTFAPETSMPVTAFPGTAEIDQIIEYLASQAAQ